MPVIFKSGVIAPLMGEATEVAVIPPNAALLGFRPDQAPASSTTLNTSSLVASATYCSTSVVNRFGSAVGGSVDRNSG